MDLSSVSAFKNLEIIARRAVEGFITGYHRSPYTGFSVEFSEHKPYNFGDSTRFIDWKLFSRTDKLYVKNFEAETNMKCHMLLDVSSSMYYPQGEHSKINFSIRALATLSYVFYKQRDAFSIRAFHQTSEIVSNLGATKKHLNQTILQLSSYLNPVEGKSSVDFISQLKTMVQITGKRSMVVIFSDFLSYIDRLDEVFDLLKQLTYNKHEVIIFQPLDYHTEMNFDFEANEVEVVDLENFSKILVNPTLVKEEYQASMKSFLKEMNLRCGQIKVDFVPVDVKYSMESVILPYLKFRNRIRR